MTDLVFEKNVGPAMAIDVQSGQAMPITSGRSTGSTGRRLPGLTLAPLQTRVFLTPRAQIGTASLDWFHLQRNWWRGTRRPPSRPLPPPPQKSALDLSDGWAWKPLDAGEDASVLAAPNVNDAAWERMRLGIWSVQHPGVKHAVFRRRFMVPPAWAKTKGQVSLWLQSWSGTTFVEQGRVFLDGRPVRDWQPDGIAGDDLKGSLKPGASHVLTVEIRGEGSLTGARGACWLWHLPQARARLDLAGEWTPSQDALHYAAPLHLPGDWSAFMAKRTVFVDGKYRGKNAVINVEAEGRLVGVLINGHWVRRHHHVIGSRWNLNLTPWMRFGAQNEIELVSWEGPSQGRVKSISLDFYDPEVYP